MFGNKELPEELKGLNLSPAEIMKAVSERDELKKKTDQLEADSKAMKESLEKSNNAFVSTKARLDELEANSKRVAAGPDNNQTKQIDFIEDPEGAVNQRINNAVIPGQVIAINAAKTAARLSARLTLSSRNLELTTGKITLSKLWDRWISEIDKAAESIPPVQLGNEVTWINLFDYIKGKHLEELMAKPGDFVESVSTNTNTRVGDPPPADKLNDTEADVTRKMSKYSKGVTQESVLAAKKKMNFVGA